MCFFVRLFNLLRCSYAGLCICFFYCKRSAHSAAPYYETLEQRNFEVWNSLSDLLECLQVAYWGLGGRDICTMWVVWWLPNASFIRWFCCLEACWGPDRRISMHSEDQRQGRGGCSMAVRRVRHCQKHVLEVQGVSKSMTSRCLEATVPPKLKSSRAESRHPSHIHRF